MTDKTFLENLWLYSPENIKRWRQGWSIGELKKGEEYIGIAYREEVRAFFDEKQNNLQIQKKQYTYLIR